MKKEWDAIRESRKNQIQVNSKSFQQTHLREVKKSVQRHSWYQSISVNCSTALHRFTNTTRTLALGGEHRIMRHLPRIPSLKDKRLPLHQDIQDPPHRRDTVTVRFADYCLPWWIYESALNNNTTKGLSVDRILLPNATTEVDFPKKLKGHPFGRHDLWVCIIRTVGDVHCNFIVLKSRILDMEWKFYAGARSVTWQCVSEVCAALRNYSLQRDRPILQ